MTEIKKELKECVILNGEVYNVGPWEYIYQLVQTESREGEPIYERQVVNPLPSGAIIENRWFEYTPERGWYESGKEPDLNFNEDVRRTFVDMFALLIQKEVITIENVPTYKEYDYKVDVQKKLSDPNA